MSKYNYKVITFGNADYSSMKAYLKWNPIDKRLMELNWSDSIMLDSVLQSAPPGLFCQCVDHLLLKVGPSGAGRRVRKSKATLCFVLDYLSFCG
jgi:hypothetical protein